MKQALKTRWIMSKNFGDFCQLALDPIDRLGSKRIESKIDFSTRAWTGCALQQAKSC